MFYLEKKYWRPLEGQTEHPGLCPDTSSFVYFVPIFEDYLC